MGLSEIYGQDKFGLSLEVYPPKTAKGEDRLMRELEVLMEFKPSLVTCTYGAGGTTQTQTLELTSRIGKQFGVQTAAHLTCVGANKKQILDWLEKAIDLGITNIVALRGDPPAGEKNFIPVDDGLSHADQLVTLIRNHYGSMGIAVAGYPETHRESPNQETDLRYLKQKVEAGADAVLTQLFYGNADFFDFRRRALAADLSIPLVPGIFPVVKLEQSKKITELCGAKLPASFEKNLLEKKNDPAGQIDVGVAYAVSQCAELLNHGIPGLHFYVLNKAEAAKRILAELGFPR